MCGRASSLTWAFYGAAVENARERERRVDAAELAAARPGRTSGSEERVGGRVDVEQSTAAAVRERREAAATRAGGSEELARSRRCKDAAALTSDAGRRAEGKEERAAAAADGGRRGELAGWRV